jgi:hypothetical protein
MTTASRHAHPAAHGLLPGTSGEIAFAVAIGLAVVLLVASKRKGGRGFTLTDMALAAAAGFCAFWPGFHHAKPGPRILLWVILALVIITVRSMYRHAVKGKQEAKPAQRSSGFYPAPRQAAGRGRR